MSHDEITTTDLSKFGNREKAMAADLLKAMTDSRSDGLPEDFEDSEVTVMMNLNSGNVFLTNSEYQCAMLTNEGKIESFYNTPYSGYEGFYDDLMAEVDGDWNTEDIEYLKELAEARSETADIKKLDDLLKA